MKFGRLIARLVIGGLFVGHGTQKLFGWFDGAGPQKTEEMMDRLEMKPARAEAFLAGASETGGGAMIAAGFLMPVGAASLIASMITAIRKVHLKNGLWSSDGGFEYNLALIAALVALVDGGPGPISLDRVLGIDDTGSGWALAALAAGAAGSTIAIEAGKREVEREQADAADGSDSQDDQAADSVADAAVSSA